MCTNTERCLCSSCYINKLLCLFWLICCRNPDMKFRNYVPHDKQLQEGKVAPPVLPKFEDPVAAMPPPSEKKEVLDYCPYNVWHLIVLWVCMWVHAWACDNFCVVLHLYVLWVWLVVQDPFVNIAPKKPNWDLRRDVQKKLDKLERRTQKAIYKIMGMYFFVFLLMFSPSNRTANLLD